jgi:triphosphoribosyl-dephospho-CoA synthase
MTRALVRMEAPPTAGLYSRQLASIAKDALIAEAELTPKPGLVDRRGSGTHRDLSLGIMRLSARTMEPFFARMAAAAAYSPIDGSLRARQGARGVLGARGPGCALGEEAFNRFDRELSVKRI